MNLTQQLFAVVQCSVGRACRIDRVRVPISIGYFKNTICDEGHSDLMCHRSVTQQFYNGVFGGGFGDVFVDRRRFMSTIMQSKLVSAFCEPP